MSLAHLVYVSHARPNLRKPDLARILTSARNNNPRLGITGLLYVVETSFLQVIEGPGANVDALFRTISLDPRHSDVRCLVQRQAHARRFPDASMSFGHIAANDARGAQLLALVQCGGRRPLDAVEIDSLHGLLGALYAEPSAGSFRRAAP